MFNRSSQLKCSHRKIDVNQFSRWEISGWNMISRIPFKVDHKSPSLNTKAWWFPAMLWSMRRLSWWICLNISSLSSWPPKMNQKIETFSPYQSYSKLSFFGQRQMDPFVHRQSSRDLWYLRPQKNHLNKNSKNCHGNGVKCKNNIKHVFDSCLKFSSLSIRFTFKLSCFQLCHRSLIFPGTAAVRSKTPSGALGSEFGARYEKDPSWFAWDFKSCYVWNLWQLCQMGLEWCETTLELEWSFQKKIPKIVYQGWGSGQWFIYPARDQLRSYLCSSAFTGSSAWERANSWNIWSCGYRHLICKTPYVSFLLQISVRQFNDIKIHNCFQRPF